ncbi:hypothetical protein BDZ94DRAFT_1260361, partial [Collybia nuda]
MNNQVRNETADPQVRAKLGVHNHVKQLERENAALRKTIRTLLAQDSDDQGSDNGRNASDDELDAEPGDGTNEFVPRDPILEDSTFRCIECAWEVVDGYCQSCCTEHNWEEEFVARVQLSISTYSDALHSDRSRTRRGTTPLRECPPYLNIPLIYREDWRVPGRFEEYESLISRGATRLMCETFHLEYSEETGIFAWADGDLYEQFAGPQMQKGDFWKIYLGRCVVLDEEDLDGASFIEGLLEEVLLFPPFDGFGVWETVEESPGIWVTRPVMTADPDEAIDDFYSESNYIDDDMDSDDMDRDVGDAELVPPVALPINTGPVISVDFYDTMDEDVDDEADEEADAQSLTDVIVVDDPGLSWQAGIPDVDWPEVGVFGERDVEGSAPRRPSPEPSDESGSEADSDFDSDEVLSGDEDVLGL